MKIDLKALGQQIGEIIARRVKEATEPLADLERRVAALEAAAKPRQRVQAPSRKI